MYDAPGFTVLMFGRAMRKQELEGSNVQRRRPGIGDHNFSCVVHML